MRWESWTETRLHGGPHVQRRAAQAGNRDLHQVRLSAADIVAELGYLKRHSLRAWYKDYLEHGEARPPKRQREPKLALEMRQAAVDCYLAHGKGLAGTMRRMGHPASRERLRDRTGGLAPGQRKHRGPNPRREPVSVEKKVQVIAELEARAGPAAQIAEKHGVSRTAPYAWRREMMGDNGGEPETKGEPVSKEYDDLPDDVEVLQDMLREAKMQLRRVQLELDVRQATLEIEKGPGAEPDLLTNAEKATMVTALRAKHRLCEALPVVGMAKSSYEYARNAQAKGETEIMPRYS
jgi:transposase-like protein